jgi:hypothetical protein
VADAGGDEQDQEKWQEMAMHGGPSGAGVWVHLIGFLLPYQQKSFLDMLHKRGKNRPDPEFFFLRL